MTRSINTIGIRLAGPVVRCADGRVVTIPWEFVAGPSTRLRATEAARLLHPDVPERLVGLRGVGTITIDGLRARALRRTLANGTHAPVWRVLPVRDPGVLVGMVLLAVAVGIGAQFGLGRWLMEDDPSDWPPMRDIEQKSLLLAGIALALATVGPVLIVILRRFSRRPAVLALKTSAAGVTWLLDDSRELAHPWADVPVSQTGNEIWPKPPRGVRFSGAVVDKHDFEIVRLAMRGRSAIPKGRSRMQLSRFIVRMALWMSVAFGILLGLHLLSRVALPNPVETPYNRPPPLPHALLVAALAWTLFVAIVAGAVARTFGWRAIRRALSPMKRRSIPRTRRLG